ncbi:galactose mutarotase [Sulfitobacter mediterraneus]|uniref:aldose epimerase family protein n=1 Tax=Sulfitobacter mediterraneus TaxID=83219 RepID=UPI001931E7ED|nr:aldose epimerase family protein [Sulfitobacter mediterraneus]MBM1312304.1 galactose mutarotase [Sulfitobacter mediterraneus]MBM1316182.1 galactose mutarotase [Sulfitobacter mediterraneus]MBM1324547.1 galactose mutarotase [Sulfitobacter mediterraneus]MBM1328458.1 galactose mutarotase [Sulfitobacter mediterraneus]MBM1399808.1 galactose mutarotase [Sulfitobacter mediterraneus]
MADHIATSPALSGAFDPIEITNGGLTATILPFGASLQDLRLDGVDHPLVLGLADPQDYQTGAAYLGAIVGRCANRIAQGRYDLAGQTFQTDQNFLGRHTLHGGAGSVDKMAWSVVSRTKSALALQLHLPDGHLGFGGALDVQVRYSVEAPATLRLEISAQGSAATPCNFAPHFYFNLDGAGTVKNHTLAIAAEQYLPVDGDLIPTGEIAAVSGTPFDFRAARQIGDRPFDHNYCTAKGRASCRPICTLAAPQSGVSMTLSSTEPGLQVYSGEFLDEPAGKTLTGQAYRAFEGLALEPQGWPDAPNQPGFPSVILQPDETYLHVSEYAFSRG